MLIGLYLVADSDWTSAAAATGQSQPALKGGVRIRTVKKNRKEIQQLFGKKIIFKKF